MCQCSLSISSGNSAKGGADKNLDWFYAASPRLSRYSMGLREPREILIRLPLFVAFGVFRAFFLAPIELVVKEAQHRNAHEDCDADVVQKLAGSFGHGSIGRLFGVSARGYAAERVDR